MMDRSVATTLTEVAVEFPGLNWIEMFSASKAGNFCGWRVAAAVGSPEFISDMKCIKGDDDSGFVAAMAAGVLHLFEKHPERIAEVRSMYDRRLSLLISIMTTAGMRLAVHPDAGFFALFHTPKQAFGQDVKDAEHFNNLMIENTDPGLVGVPFRGYMRYTVAPVDVIAHCEGIAKAIGSAQVSY
jgi:aspartate/methionine/tyrosine aminotransferase